MRAHNTVHKLVGEKGAISAEVYDGAALRWYYLMGVEIKIGIGVEQVTGLIYPITTDSSLEVDNYPHNI